MICKFLSFAFIYNSYLVAQDEITDKNLKHEYKSNI